MSENTSSEGTRGPDAAILTDTVIQETFVDPLGLEAFWFQWYLEGFVDQGYGKLKCLIGRPGSGKTHILRHLGLACQHVGYQVAAVDLAQVKVSAIEELYRVVASQMDWELLLGRLLLHIIQIGLGYPEFDGRPREFVTWGETTRQLSPTLLKRDLREAMDRYLLGADWHPEFRLAVRSWMQDQVGDSVGNESAAMLWLRGEKLGASQRKGIGVKSNVTRRNARALMASLSSLTHQAVGKGLIVLIDNLHVITLTTRVDQRPYYTKGTRDQVYEMLRELIDESPFTPYLMTVLAGNSDPLTQAKTGFPSYPALWERLQTEVRSAYINRFSDLIELDALWDGDDAGMAQLARHWREIDGAVMGDGEPTQSLGLEWGKPRRTVAELRESRRLEGGQGTW